MSAHGPTAPIQVDAAPVPALQPAKVDPGAVGFPVNVMEVPAGKDAVQSFPPSPHSIPGGVEMMSPAPFPVLVAVSVSSPAFGEPVLVTSKVAVIAVFSAMENAQAPVVLLQLCAEPDAPNQPWNTLS